jgi:hypothetical protein
MSGRERITAALRGLPVDRIPWAPLLDDYFMSSLPPALAMGSDDVRFCRYIGADVFDWHPSARKTSYRDVSITRHHRGSETFTAVETPVGTLTERRQATPVTTFIAEPKVKTIADLGPYRYWVEHTSYEPDYESFLRIDSSIGDDGLAIACGPQSPAQFMIGEDIGLERFYYLLEDHPAALTEFLDSMHEKYKEAYRIAAQSPALAVLAPEDVSTSTMSPELCRRLTMRYLNDYADIVHAEGKLFLVHMCGLLKGMTRLIAGSRIDGVESVTPPTTGDLWVDEARSAWPGKVVIGGLEPRRLAMLDCAEVEEHVRDVLRRAAPGDGFILSTGDATAHGTPVENLRAVTRVVRQWGGYPLSE